MLIVDSSVWIDYFNGNSTKETEYLYSILGKELIIIPDLILTEVLQGFDTDKDFELAKTYLLNFPIVSICNNNIALKSAENYRKLRKMGSTVRKTIDCIIATYCIENGISLLHSDKDFLPFSKYLKL